MRYAVSFFLIFSLSSSILYADEFFPFGDIVDNYYYDTLGYSIGELLESKKCPNCVEYDINDIYGTKSSDIVNVVSIFDVAYEDWRYGLTRVKGLYDTVSLPPYSSIDFIYWSKNMANIDVNIVSLKVFISRYDPSKGDLRNILYIDGEYEDVPIKYLVYPYPRSGIVKAYPGLGIVKKGEGEINGMVLDMVYVKSPLIFEKWEAEENTESVLFRVYVRNESLEVLKNVEYIHLGYSLVKTYQPFEEYVYEYILEKNETQNYGYPSIFNPNTKKECIAFGEHMESTYVGESPIVAGVRESNGQFLAYIGSRVKPYGETFCITRIPHTLYSSEIVLSSEEENSEKENNFVEDIGEVLGIKKLPQTGINISSFLVVFSILWYYLIRRLGK